MSYGCFKFLTSEVEVEAEGKIEVRSIWGLSKSTCIQNFGFLASKINELWLFKFFTSEVEVEGKVKIKVRAI